MPRKQRRTKLSTTTAVQKIPTVRQHAQDRLRGAAHSAARATAQQRVGGRAARFVSRMIRGTVPTIDDLIERDPVAWEGLLRVCAPESRGYRLSLDEAVAIENRIRRQLPQTLHRQLGRWLDSHTYETVLQQNAAFEVGVAVGLS